MAKIVSVKLLHRDFFCNHQNGGYDMQENTQIEENKTEKRRKRERKEVPFVLQLILLALLIFVLRSFVMGTTLVKGSSMEPNFYHGDLVFVNKLSMRIGAPERGNVVICRLHSDDMEENLIKRVIGLPGDEIALISDEDCEEDEYALYLNGERVEEPFLGEPMRSRGNIEYPFIVPENSYFVMGDNRNASSDSRKRSVGAIPKEDLVGKVVFRLYPFNSFGFIK